MTRGDHPYDQLKFGPERTLSSNKNVVSDVPRKRSQDHTQVCWRCGHQPAVFLGTGSKKSHLRQNETWVNAIKILGKKMKISASKSEIYFILVVKQMSKMLKRRTSVNHLYQAACLVVNPAMITTYEQMIQVANFRLFACFCFSTFYHLTSYRTGRNWIWRK